MRQKHQQWRTILLGINLFLDASFHVRSFTIPLRKSHTNVVPMLQAIPDETMMTSPAVDRSNDNEELLDQILSVAIAAAKKAGSIIAENASGTDVAEQKANSRDLLTLIDPLCEKAIQETVHATFPHHNFLGEEDVAPGSAASAAALEAQLLQQQSDGDWLWVVDPIDGTSNFVHGMPLCVPSIAVANSNNNGTIMVGVVWDPHREELYTAVRGRGSWLETSKSTTPLRVGHQTTLGDAIVAMGSPPAVASMDMSLRALPHLMPACRTIRMLGSAALMLAWVAQGRLTAYWEYDLSAWDTAAGALLVQEAGGRMTDLTGENEYSLRTRKICASNGGAVHEELIRVLRDEAGIS